MKKKDPPDAPTKAEIAAAERDRIKEACTSPSTYNGLKEVIFDEAVKVRNSSSTNLDILAANSVVIMQDPVVKSRDKALNIIVCGGRFTLELPPGAERGFRGERRLSYDIEYSVQAAADGSGMVYQIQGAEPIIYKLAIFDLSASPKGSAGAAGSRTAEAVPSPAPAPAPPPPPAERPAAEEEAPPPKPPEPRRETASQGNARPAFNCRYARSRSEKMVCASPALAALDRQMSSLFYAALGDASRGAKADLRRTRDRFLAYRNRCRSEACVADAYRGRMQEIRDIMAAD
jgi:hypothetical protein